MSKRMDGIDLLKLIGSISVFTMHLALFEDSTINFIIQLLARWAVPFFFIISSYFLFKKSENSNLSSKKLLKYIYRIVLLYLSWMIINIPSIIYRHIILKGGLSVDVFADLLKNILLSSSFTGSWYLLSSIFSAVLIWLISKKLNNKRILICTFPLFLICVLTSVYGNVLPRPLKQFFLEELCFPQNVFTGCFYFAIGKCIADNYDRIKYISKKYLAI